MAMVGCHSFQLIQCIQKGTQSGRRIVVEDTVTTTNSEWNRGWVCQFGVVQEMEVPAAFTGTG